MTKVTQRRAKEFTATATPQVEAMFGVATASLLPVVLNAVLLQLPRDALPGTTASQRRRGLA
jgi:hypothetical protein